ncbi:MAG: hypothetical protein PVF63_09720 [Gammaproteobacteria bacterium]
MRESSSLPAGILLAMTGGVGLIGYYGASHLDFPGLQYITA